MNPILLACLVFALLFAAGTIYVLVKMDPSERKDWLQRAAQVALVAENLSLDLIKGLTPDQEKALCTRMNTYLKVHGVSLRVSPTELEVILAELRLLLPAVLK